MGRTSPPNEIQDALGRLVEALRVLPGVGPKSAQRMAYYLLQHDRNGAAVLAEALGEAVSSIGHCQRCNTFTEQDLCSTCNDPRRDPSLLCVVETPADQVMVEQTMSFKGQYFVLMGRISPLDGMGPNEIHFDLASLFRQRGSQPCLSGSKSETNMPQEFPIPECRMVR